MKSLTQSFGFLLIILGLAAYFGSADAEWTDLIPALFGVGFTLLAMISVVKSIHNSMLDLAMGLSVLAIFAGLKAIPDLILIIQGESPIQVSVFATVGMLLMSTIYLVKAFLEYRKREAEFKAQMETNTDSETAD